MRSSSALPTLAQLYAPVARELEQAEHLFRDELASDLPAVNELYAHLEHLRGKQLRPALLLLAGRACGLLRPQHAVLAAVVEMVHLATLVHDDVLDGGDVRRRAATVNRAWGNSRAVLLGDLLFTHAYHLCAGLDDHYAARCIARTAVALCEGELLQIAHRGDYALSEDVYLDIIARKTAALLGTCTRLGAHYAGADAALGQRLAEFGACLGMSFQITDDLLDLVGDERAAGKSLGRDAALGELTLPLIHFLREAPAGPRAAMLQTLGDRGDKRSTRIAELLADSDSVAYARRAAENYVRNALALLEELPSSDARDSLAAMARFIPLRTS